MFARLVSRKERHMSELKLGATGMPDVPKMPPGKFLSVFGDVFVNTPPTRCRPVMIWGPPGIGKSDSVMALKELLTERTGKDCILHDVRLSLYNPTDLKGIPSPDATRQNTIWLRPELFSMDPSDEVINLLFFDEITNASPSTAAACYQLILDREIATHKLPDNCYIVCAGNRVVDKSGTQKMFKPLANRMRHVEFITDLRSWKSWAFNRPDLDGRVMSFLTFKPNLLFKYDPSSDHVAFPTPRSWASVAMTILGIENVSDVLPIIASDIGDAASCELLAFTRYYSQIPDISGIFSGKNISAPKEPSIVYALCGALVEQLRSFSVADSDKVDNLIRWMSKISMDFQALIFSDAVKANAVVLAMSQQYVAWAEKHSNFLEKVA
jgi:hypothetical protein